MTLPQADTSLDVADTRLVLDDDAIAAVEQVLAPSPVIAENVVTVEWSRIALVPPRVTHRVASDHPRGREFRVDQETLSTLAELPQAPDDEYGDQ